MKRLSDFTITNIVGMGLIFGIALASVLMVGAKPESAETVNVIAVGAISALAGFLARPALLPDQPRK